MKHIKLDLSSKALVRPPLLTEAKFRFIVLVHEHLNTIYKVRIRAVPWRSM